MKCARCGSSIRRTYSIASSDPDDCLYSCDCPPDWPVVFLGAGIVVAFVGICLLVCGVDL